MSSELKTELMQFLQANPIGHLATVQDNKPWLRVMSTARIDDDLTLWYATFDNSNKVRQIAGNPEVCVTYYTDEADALIAGTAEILRDVASKKYAWHERYAQFFPAGVSDPNYVVLKLTPASVLFRDFKKYGHQMQQVL